jgi:hypothetical protein
VVEVDVDRYGPQCEVQTPCTRSAARRVSKRWVDYPARISHHF